MGDVARYHYSVYVLKKVIIMIIIIITIICYHICDTWWRHPVETFSALLAICAGNSPVTDEFPAQRPVMRSFDVFFDLSLNKRLSKQSWGWWFETPSRTLWRHCNEYIHSIIAQSIRTKTHCPGSGFSDYSCLHINGMFPTYRHHEAINPFYGQ